MATNALPAGFALQEYRIEKVLGVGGFGLTYLALDGNLNLRVALKEFLPDDVATRGADQSIGPRSPDSAESFGWGKQRFLDESRTLASFRHPNIVRVMRFFEGNGTAYMVMEFVEGAALARLDQDPPATERGAGDLAHRAAARRPAGGAQVGLPAPRYQARQHLRARGRDAGADRLRLGAPARLRAHRHRVARLRALRAVPHARQPGPVERPLRPRRRAVLAGDRASARTKRWRASAPTRCRAPCRPATATATVPRSSPPSTGRSRPPRSSVRNRLPNGARRCWAVHGRKRPRHWTRPRSCRRLHDAKRAPTPCPPSIRRCSRSSRQSSPNTSARSPTCW